MHTVEPPQDEEAGTIRDSEIGLKRSEIHGQSAVGILITLS